MHTERTDEIQDKVFECVCMCVFVRLGGLMSVQIPVNVLTVFVKIPVMWKSFGCTLRIGQEEKTTKRKPHIDFLTSCNIYGKVFASIFYFPYFPSVIIACENMCAYMHRNGGA